MDGRDEATEASAPAIGAEKGGLSMIKTQT